jgi:hypothetical protein
MTPWTVAAWIVTVGCAASLVAICAWLMFRRDSAAADINLQESGAFSLERYRPMEVLLSESDFLFLKSEPGFTPKIGAEWKRGRRRLFRAYLTELKRDFGRLHMQARAMVTESEAAAADLVPVLMKQQIAFYRAVAFLEVRLAFQAAGIGHVDVRPLMELIESMQVDLAEFAPNAA